MPFSLGHCWIYVFGLFQDDVHLGISGGIVYHIVSSFVETIKKCFLIFYINTVNGVSYFKSEISLVSFSLTGTYMYLISDMQFQIVADFSKCLKCALSFSYANLFTFLCEFNVEFKLSALTAHQLKRESSAFCPDVRKKVTTVFYVYRIHTGKMKYGSQYTIPGTLVNRLRVLSVPGLAFFCF